MVNWTHILKSFGIFALMSLLPGLAWACACCADPGERIEEQTPIEPYVLEALEELSWGRTASLFLTDCGLECVRGISDPMESYNVEIGLVGRFLVLIMADESDQNVARIGINLTGSATMEKFTIDMTPEPNAANVVLYTEWRFTGPPITRGAVDGLDRGTHTAQFVLSGHGNRCDTDFTHWTLDVKGPDAEFRLFGNLAN